MILDVTKPGSGINFLTGGRVCPPLHQLTREASLVDSAASSQARLEAQIAALVNRPSLLIFIEVELLQELKVLKKTLEIGVGRILELPRVDR